MNFVRLLLVTIFCIHLTACFSTPLNLSSTKEKPLRIIEKIRADDSDNKKQGMEDDKQIIEEYIQEFKDMRPALVKIIGMEQDLTFLIDQLEGLTSLDNTAIFVEDEKHAQKELMGLDLSTDYYSTQVTPNNLKESDPVGSYVEASVNPSVKVMPAAPLYKFSTVKTGGNIKSAPLSESIAENNTVDADESKFTYVNKSSTPSKIPVERMPETKQVGLHLVSVSKKANLPDYWEKMLQQFPSTFANKQPLIEEVTVNGKQFYSLRAGPYSDGLANEQCRLMTATGAYCSVTSYQGKPLVL